MVGKDEDDIKARQITKQKLRVTKVPNLLLGYQDDVKKYFSHYYDYLKSRTYAPAKRRPSCA